MQKILELNNVSLCYHTKDSEIKAIENLSFSVESGEFIAIIGPSGCGKTSVLSLLAGLIKQTEGEIILNGKPLDKPSENLGYMLQSDQLFPWRTIEKNILLPLEIKRIKTKENIDYINGLLEKYGLKEFKTLYPKQLSGGMRQRVALIRTLAYRPDLLLLDEPFSALDYQTRLSVCEDVYRIIKTEKKSTILVTHDISEAISVADRIIVLTQRPATVSNIYDIGWNLSPNKRREQDKFHVWFEILRKELNV